MGEDNNMVNYGFSVRMSRVTDVIHPILGSLRTEISKEEFNTLCDRGFINILALNRIVREFKNQEETSLRPEEFIYENLLKIAS